MPREYTHFGDHVQRVLWCCVLRCSVLHNTVLQLLLFCALIVVACNAEEPLNGGHAEVGASAEPANFSRSASFHRKRALERSFDELVQHVQKKDYANAAAVVQSILADDANLFVEYEGGIFQARSLAFALLRKFPSEVQRAFQRLSESDAEALLQDAITSEDEERLMLVAKQYRSTSTGLRALLMLTSVKYDQGDMATARLMLREYLKSYRNGEIPESFLTRMQRLDELIELEDVQSKDTEPVIVVSGQTDWVSQLGLSAQTQNIIQESLVDLREHGLNPLLTSVVVTLEDGMVLSSPFDVRKLNPDTGEVLWKRPYKGYGIQVFQEPEDLSDSNRKQVFTQVILHRLYGESTYTSLSSFKKKVYIIERQQLKVLNNQEGQKKEFPSNQVVCLNGETGEPVWTFAGEALAPCYFSSAPTVHGERLYVQGEAEQTGTLTLFILNATTGKLLQQVELAQSQLPFDTDRRRHTQSCPVVVTDELILCPTGAGAIVAVDPVWHEVLWGYRYPRSDAIASGSTAGLPNPEVFGYQWWNGWQAVQAVATENYVALATPEADEFVVLNIQSGTVKWKRPRGDALFVARADEATGLILIGKEFAEAIDISTGKTLWKSPILVPAGFGAVVGDEYLLPTHEAGITRIQLASGEVQAPEKPWVAFQHETLSTDLSTRNLYVAGHQLYEVGTEQFSKLSLPLSQLEIAHSEVQPPLLFNDLFKAFLTEDGARVKEILESWLATDEYGRDSSFRRELAEFLIRQLPQLPISIDRPELESFVSRLLDSDWDLANWRQHQLQQLLDKSDWLSLFEIWLTEDAGIWNQQLPVPDSQHRARLDRWLQGAVEEALSVMSETDRKAFDASLLQAWSAHVERFPKSKLQTLKRFGNTSDAVPREPDEEPVSPLAEGIPWPDRVPVQVVKPRQFTNIAFPVPVETPRASLFSRLNIDLDWPGSSGVIFSSDQKRNWDCHFPNTTSSLRHDHDLVHGWGFQNLLVMQVGSEVFGIAPFTENGVRSARRIWPAIGEKTINTLGNRSSLMLTFRQDHPIQRPGFVSANVDRVDEFRHFSADVGPVTSEYFCIQQKGMLVAYDTADGSELWRRYDLPERAYCFGNEHEVILISSENNHLQRLRVADGKEFSAVHCPVNLNEIVLSQGSQVITASGDVTRFEAAIETPKLAHDLQPPVIPMQLTCTDLATQFVVWERDWAAGAVPFEVDQEWMGIAHSGNSIEFINRQTGGTVATHISEILQPITRIACSVGSESLLVAISTTIDDEQLQSAPQRYQGYRRPMINGKLFAFARNTGKWEWEIDLPNTVFPIDQPLELPVFITAEARHHQKSGSTGSPGSRLRCYSRRTGELLYENESQNPTLTQYGITASRKKEQIIINTQTMQLELDYSLPKEQAAEVE